MHAKQKATCSDSTVRNSRAVETRGRGGGGGAAAVHAVAATIYTDLQHHLQLGLRPSHRQQEQQVHPAQIQFQQEQTHPSSGRALLHTTKHQAMLKPCRQSQRLTVYGHHGHLSQMYRETKSLTGIHVTG